MEGLSVRIGIEKPAPFACVIDAMAAGLSDAAAAGLIQCVPIANILGKDEVAWAGKGVHRRQVEVEVQVQVKGEVSRGRVERAGVRSVKMCVQASTYSLICPLPSTMNFEQVSSSSPMGPRACRRLVLMPISAPRPNS